MGEVGAALAPCLGGAQKRPESGREVRSLRRRSCPLCRGAELRTRLLHSPSTSSSSSRFHCTPVGFWEKTDYRAPSWLFNALNFSRGHLFPSPPLSFRTPGNYTSRGFGRRLSLSLLRSVASAPSSPFAALISLGLSSWMVYHWAQR